MVCGPQGGDTRYAGCSWWEEEQGDEECEYVCVRCCLPLRSVVLYNAMINFSFLNVRCGYSSRFRFTHEILSPRKKRQTIITYLPGHMNAY